MSLSAALAVTDRAMSESLLRARAAKNSRLKLAAEMVSTSVALRQWALEGAIAQLEDDGEVSASHMAVLADREQKFKSALESFAKEAGL